MKFLPYVIVFTTLAATPALSEDSQTRYSDALRSAMHSQALQKYASAEKYYQISYDAARSAFGEKDNRVARVLNRLGQVAYLQGNYLRARDRFRMSLDVYKSSPGANAEDRAAVWNNLGATEEELGNFSRSLEYFRKVIDYYQQAGRANDRGAAVTLSNLALVQAMVGDQQEAVDSATRAVDLLEPGRLSMDLIESLTALGRIQTLLDDHASAARSLERARWGLAQIGGEETFVAAQVFTYLGRLYAATQRTKEAEPLYQRALRIEERLVSPQHPTYLITLKSYASLLRETGRKREAKELEARFHDGVAGSQQQAITKSVVDVRTLMRESR
jgi:tetratricopeptide (TPR) repeat protein